MINRMQEPAGVACALAEDDVFHYASRTDLAFAVMFFFTQSKSALPQYSIWSDDTPIERKSTRTFTASREKGDTQTASGVAPLSCCFCSVRPTSSCDMAR